MIRSRLTRLSDLAHDAASWTVLALVILSAPLAVVASLHIY